VYSGSSLLADLNVQPVSGLYKNFDKMSPSEFEFLINLIGEKNLKKGQCVMLTKIKLHLNLLSIPGEFVEVLYN